MERNLISSKRKASFEYLETIHFDFPLMLWWRWLANERDFAYNMNDAEKKLRGHLPMSIHKFSSKSPTHVMYYQVRFGEDAGIILFEK